MSSRSSFSRLTWWVSPAGYPLLGHPGALGSGPAPWTDPLMVCVSKVPEAEEGGG